jgi:hypothetical protein
VYYLKSDTPWSLMIISVGKSGEEKQYQQWPERTASTAIVATGFLETHIFQTTQLNGITSSGRFEQFEFALLEASAPL